MKKVVFSLLMICALNGFGTLCAAAGERQREGTFQFFVEKFRGAHVEVWATSTDTIGQVKKSVEKSLAEIGIEPREQIYKLAGKKLTDDMTLADAGVGQGSKITLSYESFEGSADEWGTVPEGNKVVSKGKRPTRGGSTTKKDIGIVGTGEGQYQIYIKTLGGKTTTVWVRPTDTIGHVKTLVEEADGVPVVRQRFIFRGGQLDDASTIENAGVEEKNTIHRFTRMPKEVVEPKQIELGITGQDGKKFKVSIPAGSTIRDLKDELELKIDIDPEKQLFIGGQTPIPLESDEKKLEDFNILDGTEISVKAVEQESPEQIPPQVGEKRVDPVLEAIEAAEINGASKVMTVDAEDEEKQSEPQFSNTQMFFGGLLLVGGAVAVYKFYKHWQKKWKGLEEREKQEEQQKQRSQQLLSQTRAQAA